MITPNIPIPSTNAQIEQTTMIGLVNSTSGITGSPALVSLTRNPASIPADNASSNVTRGDVQPYSVAQVSASSSGTTVAISVANPIQSSCRVDPLGFRFGNSK